MPQDVSGMDTPGQVKMLEELGKPFILLLGSLSGRH